MRFLVGRFSRSESGMVNREVGMLFAAILVWILGVGAVAPLQYVMEGFSRSSSFPGDASRDSIGFVKVNS